MKTFLKQYTEWATNLKPNVFEKTRLKLTALYVGTMVIILALFSGALYNAISKNVRVRLAARPIPAFGLITQPRIPWEIQEEVKNEILEDIRRSIMLLDLCLLVLIAGVGYLLAGKSLEPVQKAFEREKRFVADASHDLRTPLATLQSEIEVALRAKPNKEIEKLLKSNLEEVQRMSMLVNDLLLVAKLNDHAALPMSSFHVREVITKAIASTEKKAQEKQITFTHTLEDGIMLGRESLLVRAITNIIDNAVTYIEKGSVTITGIREKYLYRITVSDTGPGISKKDLPHIFDRFYRGSKSRTDVGHSGLGLAIAKEVILLHQGRITITSSEGEGTVATIVLPLVEK